MRNETRIGVTKPFHCDSWTVEAQRGYPLNENFPGHRKKHVDAVWRSGTQQAFGVACPSIHGSLQVTVLGNLTVSETIAATAVDVVLWMHHATLRE